jgi:hypothetical protein
MGILPTKTRDGREAPYGLDMSGEPQTVERAFEVYRPSASRPLDLPFDPTRCAKRVYGGFYGITQCAVKTPKHEELGYRWCGNHRPSRQIKREQESNERWRLRRIEWDYSSALASAKHAVWQAVLTYASVMEQFGHGSEESTAAHDALLDAIWAYQKLACEKPSEVTK